MTQKLELDKITPPMNGEAYITCSCGQKVAYDPTGHDRPKCCSRCADKLSRRIKESYPKDDDVVGIQTYFQGMSLDDAIYSATRRKIA